MPKPMQLEPESLASDESPGEHGCASVHFYSSDLALLNYLLQDLRALVRRAAKGEITLDAYREMSWQVHGLARRTVICDPIEIVRARDVCIVGFFGDRRRTREAQQVDTTEIGVIAQFANHPGLLSYSSIELVDNQWANLVVHESADDRERWRGCPVHIPAAEDLAPLVYHSVRIHNGGISGGPVGSEPVVIETTKYFDYDVKPMWHGMRTLPARA